MLGQGLLLMVAGMGTVFVFLCLLVLGMMALGAYFKANESRFMETAPAAKPRKAANGSNMPAVIAAIAVSLEHRHQKSD